MYITAEFCNFDGHVANRGLQSSKPYARITFVKAGMMELADVTDSKSTAPISLIPGRPPVIRAELIIEYRILFSYPS